MMLQLFFYIFAFLLIWYASGLIVTSVDKLAHKLNLSSFAVSFFLLGILTSIPEISVGISSLIDNKPEIFVGNLIGGIIVIFLLIIPLLAIFGNGIKLTHQMNKDQLIIALLIIISPSVFTFDGLIGIIEGITALLLYGFLILTIEKRKGLFERLRDNIFQNKNQADFEIVKIIIGVVIVFLVSKYIVDTTIYFSQIFNISSFLISLVIVSMGTNLPELSLVFRSLMLKKKEVALGDYLGSAAANTGVFGFLILLKGSNIFVQNHFYQVFVFIAGGLTLFYIFSRSKQDISRREGLVLLFVYFLFLLME